MTKNMFVTDHAVARFSKRWRPFVPSAVAKAELMALNQSARPTGTMTRQNNAELYTATTTAGETVLLAIRNNTVITVLPPNSVDGELAQGPDSDWKEESRLTLSLCPLRSNEQEKLRKEELAAQEVEAAKELVEAWKTGAKNPSTQELRLALEALTEGDRVEIDKIRAAKGIIQKWKAGTSVYSNKALKKAHVVLGLKWEKNESTPQDR